QRDPVPPGRHAAVHRQRVPGPEHHRDVHLPGGADREQPMSRALVLMLLTAFSGSVLMAGAVFTRTMLAGGNTLTARSSFGLTQTAPCFSNDGSGPCATLSFRRLSG